MKYFDRSDAVNLANNLKNNLTENVTKKGIELLVNTVIGMDEVLKNYLQEMEFIQRQGEVVVTRNEVGVIVSVTRQDEDGRVLSVIA